MINDTGYRAVRWQEPIIFQLSKKGRRGFIPPKVEEAVKSQAGDVLSELPDRIRRKEPPALPELAEPQVVRHYIRLSQQNFGVDSGINVGTGTTTLKYNPKINETLARSPKIAELHPLQDESTVQGILQVMHELGLWLCEISGMDECSVQPRAGASAVFANARIMHAYHESRGEGHKDEVITTVLSHPCDGASPAMAGYKVVTLYPNEETGVPDIEALKAAASNRTAGIMITDPYDTGVFDPNLEEYIKIVHEVGGLVAIDQANANSVLGRLRVGDAGADMCHFNLHKSFAIPHASCGPGSAPICVKAKLAKFLPIPQVRLNESRYYLDYDVPDSIGKVGGFFGVVPNVLRAYAWILSMGKEGLLTTSEVAVMNNNYLIKKLQNVRGVALPWSKAHPFRLQEARFSLEQMKRDTGIGIDDLNRRIVDFGIQRCFTSHEPWFVPEPFTPEPPESASKEDLDKFVEVLDRISEEAYSTPDVIRTAPHNCAISKIDTSYSHDPSKWALTWRAYQKKQTSR